MRQIKKIKIISLAIACSLGFIVLSCFTQSAFSKPKKSEPLSSNTVDEDQFDLEGSTDKTNKTSKNIKSSRSKDKEQKPAIYKIQSKLKKLENLEVDFVQKIYTPLRNKTRVVEGRGYFSYPNKFKWVREKPVREEIIYNGSSLVIYKPDEKTAMKLNSSSDRSQEVENITDMILDTATLLEKYKVIESKLDDTTIFLKLFPKEDDSNVTDIYITIDTVKNYVDNLKIYYTDKKNWEFSFSNPSTKKIPASTFKFRAPKGVKITTDL